MKWDYYKELHFWPFSHKKNMLLKQNKQANENQMPKLWVEDEEVAP